MGMFADIGAFSNGIMPSDLGPRKFVPSFEAPSGTYLYCSPTGTGTLATLGSPCSFPTVTTLAQPGDRVIMRGGADYAFPSGGWAIGCIGNAANPIIFEPYLGESVAIDGSGVAPIPGISYLDLTGNFVHMRGFEIKNMPGQGLRIVGSDNKIENMDIHHNKLTGIHIQNPADNTLQSTAAQSRNLITSCKLHDNSDVGLVGSGMDEGENADGASATQGFDNIFEYLDVYNNSDDGIDIWKSTRSIIRYCMSHGNGYGLKGDGNGYKLGAPSFTSDGLIEHSIAYLNKTRDFTANGALNVIMRYLTAFGTDVAFDTVSDTILESCISGSAAVGTTGVQSNNSWQRSGTPAFITTNSAADGFLVPDFEDRIYPPENVLQYKFNADGTLTKSNPSNRYLRFNNVTYASVTEIFITNKNRKMEDTLTLASELKTGQVIKVSSTANKHLALKLSANAVNETGYVRLTGTVVMQRGGVFFPEEILTIQVL